MAPERRDDLTELYLQASALDPRRPGAQMRAAVQAHARMLAQTPAPGHAQARGARAPAANEVRWKMSALAGVAVLGLAGLLALQFDRGTTEEKDLVSGAPKSANPVARDAPSSAAPPEPGATATATAPGATVTAQGAAAKESQAGARADTPAAAGPTPAPAPADGAPARGQVHQPATAAAPAGTTPPVPAAVPARAAPAVPAAPAALPPPLAKVEPDMAAARRLDDAPRARAEQKSSASESRATAAGAMRGTGSSATAANALEPTQALLDAARKGRTESLEPLFAQGAQIDATDAQGRTALMLAAIGNHADMVRRLLAAGASRAMRDPSGQSAADHARRLGHEEIVRLLVTAP